MSDYSPEMVVLAQDLVDQLNAILTTNQNWKIVPQANGQLVSQFPTGAPPPPPAPTIATIPNFTNKSAAFSIDLSTYVANSYTSLAVAGLSSGWSFSGTTLSYSGTGVFTASVQLVANWSGGQILSNTFTVQSVATVSANTFAPPTPTGLTAALVNGAIQIAFNPSCAPAPPGLAWNGMAGYQLEKMVNGGAGSIVASLGAPTHGVDFFPTPQDIGSPATPGTTTQTGSTFSMTGYGAGYYGTADQGQMAPFAITGNFIVTFEVGVFTCANNFAKCGADARVAIDSVNGSGSPHVFATVKPLSTGIGGSMDYRPTQAGATSNTGDVAQTANTALYVMFSRVGNVFTQWISTNPNTLGTSASQVGQVTVTLPAQLYVGPVCESGVLGDEAICSIQNWVVSQDPILGYVDSAVSAGNTYNYAVRATDGTNISPYSLGTTLVYSSGGTTNSVLTYIKGLASAGTKHILIGQHSNYWDSNVMDNVTPIPTLSGVNGKDVAILGLSNDWVGTSVEGTAPNGPNGCVTLANAQIAKGRIILMSQSPVNPLNGAPYSDAITPGKAAYTTWQNYCIAQLGKIKQINGPVLWRPFIELNGSWSWWTSTQGTQQATFITLWQQLHALAAAQGVTNIIWLLNLNAFQSTGWYPGDAYVDMVSIDSYPIVANDPIYAYLTASGSGGGKPLIYAETGGNTNNSNETPNSFDNSTLLATIKAHYPLAVGMVVWCQNEGIAQQNGAATLMNDPASITLSDLPAGV